MKWSRVDRNLELQLRQVWQKKQRIIGQSDAHKCAKSCIAMGLSIRFRVQFGSVPAISTVKYIDQFREEFCACYSNQDKFQQYYYSPSFPLKLLRVIRFQNGIIYLMGFFSPFSLRYSVLLLLNYCFCNRINVFIFIANRVKLTIFLFTQSPNCNMFRASTKLNNDYFLCEARNSHAMSTKQRNKKNTVATLETGINFMMELKQ